MSGWQERYASKLEPVQAAIRRIKRGDRVFIGSACGEPQALVRGMIDAAGSLADVELVQALTLTAAPYTEPRFAASFRMNALFIGQGLRDAVNEARADYTPIHLSQVPALFRSGQMDLDVALVMVSPPDEHGFCSLGVSVDITKAAVETARLVIAQVNALMPHTLGASAVHVDRLHSLVEVNEPLVEWPAYEHDDVERSIAAHVARLVPDGSTLQIGIGRGPDAILLALDEKNDLGIHTEILSDSVMKLSNRGVITGRFKTLNPGKMVASLAAGSRELYAWLADNQYVEMHPAEYTNNPFVISRHDNMVTVNAALEVDLTGQVVADSIGYHLHSGFGGHTDFVRGAAWAKNGKSIIALPSTAMTPSGPRSRITPWLQEGSGVVATRADVRYVVTEYGVAYLYGKSLRERAMALINIAHPDFRSQLLHSAKRRHIVYPDQIMPPATQPYPAKYEETITLADGTPVFIRAIRSNDEQLIKDMFYSFSEQTVYLRYHGLLKAMPHNKLQVFCNVDYDTEMALLALVGASGNEQVVGVGRYMTDAAKVSADLAFVVGDTWQHKGLGTYLFMRMLQIAQESGIRKVHADVLIENSGMLKIFHRSGLHIDTSTDGGVVRVHMVLPDKPFQPPLPKGISIGPNTGRASESQGGDSHGA
jgi:acyl-CoA hydrolase